MEKTISQSTRISQIETDNMYRTSDNESGSSSPDVLSREQMTEFDNDDLLNREGNHDRNRIEQRFSDMNRRIG